MRSWPIFMPAVSLIMLICLPASAQVTRCTDAAGKVTYSDSGCANTTTKSSQVLSREQVERTRANDQASQRYFLEQGARAEDQARSRPSLRAPIQQQPSPQNAGGPVLLDHDPNQRIRAQEERNMAKRAAELEAGSRARRDYEDRVRNAPVTVNSCDRFGCQTNKGYAPRTD